MGDFLIRAFDVYVDGFPPHVEYAASRGKALRGAWNSYCSYRAVSFKDFLRIARCRAGLPNDGRFGREIVVGGKPAFYVSSNRQYVQFARPGGEEVFNAHPYDVEPEGVRPWTYRPVQHGESVG